MDFKMILVIIWTPVEGQRAGHLQVLFDSSAPRNGHGGMIGVFILLAAS